MLDPPDVNPMAVWSITKPVPVLFDEVLVSVELRVSVLVRVSVVYLVPVPVKDERV